MLPIVRRFVLFCIMLCLITLPALAQDATNTPFVITATPASVRGIVTLDTNLWNDPLVRDSTPVTSIASGTNIAVTGINPRADRYQIRAYGDTFWITVEALELTGDTVNLPIIPETVFAATATPESFATQIPTPAPTFTLAPALFLPGEPMGYGAHITGVTNNETTLNTMRGLEMDWVKIRVMYETGADLENIIQQIDDAHAAGFKVLLTIVGTVEDLTQGADIYIAEYIDDVATLAESGADAIEIWEMPNTSENWLPEQLSGSDYVLRLLLPAYRMIKARSPRTIIVSAAPRPLTSDEALAGESITDERFMRDFVAVRGDEFVDCVGMRYTEGMVSPTSTGGDTRDGHQNRYYSRLLQQYNGIVSSRKPVCVTAFGYFNPENSDTLSEAYEWAEDITPQEIAEWQTMARYRSAMGDDILLLIVENMDFVDTGDLRENYAILDAEGVCADFCEVMQERIALERLPLLRLTDGTNIRSGASIDFQPPLSQARSNSNYRVYAVNPTGEWVKIQYGDDDDFGWVQLRFGTLSASLEYVPIETGAVLPDATMTPRPRPTNTPTPTMTFTPSPTSDVTEAGD
ncbi:MAG: hypothetical protein ACPG7F_13435 [Aggregatilineales bacterium]